ncbi:hypothetical protein B0181_02415 [Moraxella caviae]|uniref:Antitoxin n=1 Tax=Moraxella caviae TaxID=34060 RepID=A0A1T0A854_9GAMM|nr:type II toxin-antitoxin system Phd/YefM family antitoxin [Moraxella caviae]OOR91904.1 hypothetical protein B0181_02415 [Moraxella caviae]STZ09758.1 Uncharacterised protein [Moraxella caviae]
MYMTSREFNQRTSYAQRQADIAPVIITKRGEPSYVLLRYDDYQKNKLNPAGSREFVSAKDAYLALDIPDEVADIEFELPTRSTNNRPPVDFGEL